MPTCIYSKFSEWLKPQPIHRWLILPFMVLFFTSAQAQDPFITTWQVAAGNLSITIPTHASYAYDYTVNWGDGSTISGYKGNATHNYASAGTYTVSITGTFPAIHFFSVDQNNRDKIRTVQQWGDNAWLTMYQAFFNCTNLRVTASDAPDLSNTTDLGFMFIGCSSFNQSINHWDVSKITSMGGMFRDSRYNQPLNNWNVSKVTNMYNMFFGNTTFNQDITDWDVSSVTTMQWMFMAASAFNQPIGKWNVSNVSNMDQMLNFASSFNQSLGDWNISNVVNMRNLLNRTAMSVENYDATLNGWATLEPGETIQRNVTFGGQGRSFSCDGKYARHVLTNDYGWIIDDVGTTCQPFRTTWLTTDNQITIPTFASEAYDYEIFWLNLTNPGNNEGSERGVTGNSTITDLENGSVYLIEISGDFPRIFFNNTGDKDKIRSIEHFGNNAWTSMAHAFEGCSELQFGESVNNPNLTNVTDMSYMFAGAGKINKDLSYWDVSTVSNMSHMFYQAASFDNSLSEWDIHQVTDMTDMLSGSGLSTTNYDATLKSWVRLDEDDDLAARTLGAQGLTFCDSRIDRDKLINTYNWIIVGDGPDQTYPPVPIATTIPVLSDPVAITSLVPPMALAGCGTVPIEGTTDATLPITETTQITWTFTDEFGNQSTQQQAVFIDFAPFIITCQTVYEDHFISIPINDDYLDDYNFWVDWGDGSGGSQVYTGEWLEENYSAHHQYANEGIYTIKIYGEFPSPQFGNRYSGHESLLTIEQWGDIQWKSMEKAFQSAYRLRYNATDVPDLSQVSSLSAMFADCRSFDGDISAWDVSTITDMSFMFSGYYSETIFNQNINNWNVSNVTNMKGMFEYSTKFNQDLSSWNVSKVENMASMFYRASAFNQNLGGWDISASSDMSDMLSYSRLSPDNYEATLLGWATLQEGEVQIPEGITLGARERYYCNDVGRVLLTGDKSWKIEYDKPLGDGVIFDVKDLPMLFSEIPLTLVAPTAVSCNGTITAVTETPFPITTPQTITWLYDDGNELTEDYIQKQYVFVGKPFVTTWQTSYNYVDIPLSEYYVYNNGYSFVVDWGDPDQPGIDETIYDAERIEYYGLPYHYYNEPGVYTIKIYGKFPQMKEYEYYDYDFYTNLRSIEQWGDIEWKSMENAFDGADNMVINASDAPNLSQVTNLSYMFNNAAKANANIGHWDISTITNMSNMLSNTNFSVKNYTATLNAWALQEDLPSAITLGAAGLSYCNEDGTGHPDLVDLGWTIQDAGNACPLPPAFDEIINQVIDEDVTLNLTITASTGDNPFTFRLDEASLAKGMAIDEVSGAYRWIGDNDDVGEHQVTVYADDGEYGASKTFTVTVVNVNDAPVLSLINNLNTNEDLVVSFTANASDVDSEILSYSLDAVSIAKGMMINSSTGVFNWTPVESQSGDHEVTVIVSDGELTADQKFMITVNPVNDAPLLNAIANKAVNEKVLLTFSASATDLENTPLLYSLDQASLAKGMTIESPSGVFSWTPRADQAGSHEVTLTVSDGELSDALSFTITVNAVNDQPVLTIIGDKSVNEEVELTFTVSAVDEEGDALTYSLDAASMNKGMQIGSTSGLFTWTPSSEQIGNHQVLITVNDGSLTTSETISITVNAINDAPVLTLNAGLTISQGAQTTITTALLSATDEDNTDAQLIYSISTDVSNGTLFLNAAALTVGSTFTQEDITNGQLSYRHDGLNGASDSFSFTLSDGSGATLDAVNFTISIDIITEISPSASIRGMTVYPNPVESQTTVRLSNTYYGLVVLRIIDMSGRTLAETRKSKHDEIIEIPLDLSTLPTGLLILEVGMGTIVGSSRLEKK